LITLCFNNIWGWW